MPLFLEKIECNRQSKFIIHWLVVKVTISKNKCVTEAEVRYKYIFKNDIQSIHEMKRCNNFYLMHFENSNSKSV